MRDEVMAAALVLLLGPAGAAAQECGVYVLERSGDEFEVLRESVRDGDVKVFTRGGTFVSLIMPWSPGQSGDVVQAATAPVADVVRCEAGTATVTVQSRDGASRALPAVAAGALSRYWMRVSVTPGSGRAAVFIIEPGGRVVRDTLAPPTDMFRGMVPLEPADVSITTEVREAPAATVSGAAALRRGGPYLLARLAVPGGGEGEVIVDLGASRTLLTRELLPPGTETSALVAVEHGPEGEQTRAGAVGALGGGVAGVSTARLPEVRLGDVRYEGVRVNVIDSLPVIGGSRIAGIVGTDLLARGRVTRVTATAAGGELELLDGPQPAAGALVTEVPFSLVGGLIVLTAYAGDAAVPFILDTGARSTLLTEAAAAALGLELTATRDTFRGLDGSPVVARGAVVPSLRLGTASLDSLEVNVAPLPVLEALGLPRGGLLGQNLWERFSALEVAWEERLVRFYR